MKRSPTHVPPSVWTPLDRGLGVLGLMIACFGGVLAFVLIPLSWIGFLLMVMVSSLSATLLLRTWWAILVVPAAVWVGTVGATLVYGALHSLLTDPTWRGGTLEFSAILLGIAVGPSVLSVLFVRLVSVWFQQRAFHHATE